MEPRTALEMRSFLQDFATLSTNREIGNQRMSAAAARNDGRLSPVVTLGAVSVNVGADAVIGEKPSQDFPDALRAYRIRQGLSLAALARRAGVDKATLSRWESGAGRPRVPELTAVLEALAVPPAHHPAFFASLDRIRGLRALRGEDNSESLRQRNGTTVQQTATRTAPAMLPPVPCGGDLLRAMRLRNGRTQEEVATNLGVAVSTVHRWERSEVWPDSATLHTLCHLLGAHPAEIAALTRGRFALSADLPNDFLRPLSRVEAIETLFQRVYRLVTRRSLEPDDEALDDLRYLVLEGQVWSLAARTDSPAAHLLLSHLYARRAESLIHRYREVESLRYAERALECASSLPSRLRGPFDWENLWQYSPESLAVVFRAAALARLGSQKGRGADASRAAYRRAARLLLDHAGPLSAPNLEMRAALVSRAANFMALAGDGKAAESLAWEAHGLSRPCDPLSVVRFRQRDIARVYLCLGRAADAAPLVEELVATEPSIVTTGVQIDDLLLQAEVCLKLGGTHLGQAQTALMAARSAAKAGNVTFHQRRMDALTATLARHG
jgi:transcriptional regulator with XRE-family HTH domain